MLRIFCFVGILSFVLACKSGSYELKQTENLEGNWVSKDYLEAIKQNHSPAETAQNLFFYATELIINKQKGDSIEVYNGQMEMSVLPFRRSGDTLKLKLNQDPETDILYAAEDETLYFVDHSLNRVFRFVRADTNLLDKTFKPTAIAFPTIVNNATFTGFWQMLEHNSTEKIIEFDKFGNLKGWDKYQNYSIVVNGEMAANESGDVIILSKGEKSEAYGFRAKADTISIYKLIQSNDPDEKEKFRNGQPIALLQRIRGKAK